MNIRLSSVWLAGVLLLPTTAFAFTHLVVPGETLASIAEKAYGRIQNEKVIVAANSLDARGGSPIVPGMRIEVPAIEHRRVEAGDTWAALAEELLGAETRAQVLASANGSSPWLVPEVGTEILIPYNLRVVAQDRDTLVSIAYRYLGDMNKAWILDHYNEIRGRELKRGDVVLVPLSDLPLTAAGKEEARVAALRLGSQSRGEARAAQRQVGRELPSLYADVRGGRYVGAVRRGNAFLSSGELTKPQQAAIYRLLLEAYVALGSGGLATEACNRWRRADPTATLDPMHLSPKIIDACEIGAP